MKEYSGFLRKLGQLSVHITETLHRFGSNATRLMNLMCGSSVQKLQGRWSTMLHLGISVLLVGSSRITNTMHLFKETHGGVKYTSVYSV